MNRTQVQVTLLTRKAAAARNLIFTCYYSTKQTQHQLRDQQTHFVTSYQGGSDRRWYLFKLVRRVEMVPVGGRAQQVPHVRRDVTHARLVALAARVAQERAEHARVHVRAQLYLSHHHNVNIIDTSTSSLGVGI